MDRKLTDADIRRIADLAHIELSADELSRFAGQLDDILRYVETLQQVDTTGIEPTSHPLALDAALRADDPVPSLDRAAALAEAPGTTPRTGLFKVPKVL
jgi:aspartyl-tRNA(Asn)/glutamyl-tRNA(Gln) amidotransferase subunit C